MRQTPSVGSTDGEGEPGLKTCASDAAPSTGATMPSALPVSFRFRSRRLKPGLVGKLRSNNNGVTGQITNSLAEEPDHSSPQKPASATPAAYDAIRVIDGYAAATARRIARAPRTQRAVITPLLVATVQRPPWRAMECTRPTPGMRSPVETPMMPLGPFSIAVPLITSRTTHSVTFLASTGTWVFVAAGGVEAGTEGRSGAVIGIAASVTLLVAGAG